MMIFLFADVVVVAVAVAPINNDNYKDDTINDRDDYDDDV